jgi:CTP:phosphocholine cytidylyltransferase-like protein/thiamine kinase-like enzyme
MLSKIEFENLRKISESKTFELDTDVVSDLISKGLIEKDFAITELGEKELSLHQVDNAIILAAGMSTRFVPISYELPKGLISVKGEVLIERIIRQLQEAGVNEVVVVVGYMMEKFLYLRDKYNVKLVVNNEYSSKNTHSSIYVARDYLKNTYICCSDNYYPENPFHKYEYKAYYCSIFLPGISYVERAFTFDSDGLIIDTNKPSHDQWIMYGHAYYDNDFSTKFKPILKSYYGRTGVENMYWENVYAENLDKLPMYIKQVNDGEILEFDSMEELKAYDPEFIKHNKIKVFENICNTLNCEISDIGDIEIIKKGLNNRSFKFSCKGENYVYRHPGINASGIIDRKKEATALNIAKKLGVDSTLIYVNEEEGWKISSLVDITEEFDFSNDDHVKLLANSLKTLHSSNIQLDFTFDYYEESNKLIEYIRRIDSTTYNTLSALRNKVMPIVEYLKDNKWQQSICHNDIYEPNLLISRDGLELIDWEFAGNSDIGYDICKLFTMHNPQLKDVDKWLIYYYGRETTMEEKLHLFACASIIYYYWFVWSVYESKRAGQASNYVMGWFDRMNHYVDIVLEYLKDGE